MAGLYDSLSGKGIISAIGDNPVARYVQSKYSQDDLNHDVGGAILNARNAISGKDEGAIPVPDALKDKVNNFQNDVQGALAPTDPAHNPAESGAAPTTDPNSQQGGADAQAAQQAAMDVTKQAVADDATKGGGVPTPVTTQDPAAALATRNQNIQAGVGHATTGANQPPVPKPLTEQQQKNVMLNDAGQETFKSMNTVGEWYNSSSFLMGMMQTGLSLLDGKGYSESFATGAKYFDQHYGQEQRKAWADDLLNKGYDRQEIQQYVETGDSKVLTSPEQRAFQQQQQQNQLQQGQLGIQVGQQNLEKAQYANTPEMRALDVQERQNKMNYNNAMIQQMQGNLQLKQQEAPIKAQTMADNAAAAKSRAEVAQQKQQIQTAATTKLADGTSAMVSPMTVGGRHIILNPKTGRMETNAKGQIWVVGENGQAMQVSGNPQAAEAANASVGRSMKLINDFDGKGTQLFGPTGDMAKNWGDFWGQRTSADQKSQIQTLQNSLHSAALAKVEMESNGNAVREGQLKAEVDSLGSLVDKNGDPLPISAGQAGRILQGYRDYLGFVGAASDNQLAKSGATEEGKKMANVIPVGTRSQDGKWVAVKSGNQYDQSIWAPAQ